MLYPAYITYVGTGGLPHVLSDLGIVSFLTFLVPGMT